MSADLVICVDPNTDDERLVTRLGLVLTDSEWAALFFDVMSCPRPADESPVSDDNIHRWTERWSARFREALPEYPMLCRIIDLYRNIWFMPKEIEQLRDDSLRACALTSNSVAIGGLKKLVFACDEALKLSWGLVLVGD